MNKNTLYGIIGFLFIVIVGLLGYLFVPDQIMMKQTENIGNVVVGKTAGEIPFPGYSKVMADHCVMMAEMDGCEPYNALREKEIFTLKNVLPDAEIDISALPMAKPIEVIELQDGDTFDMEVTQVQKEIGNDTVVMLAYNGSIPGPILKAPQGAKVTLNFTNKVSDLETTLHSHGLRQDYTMDGVPKDMGGTQDPVKTGKSFRYELEFPDTGVFWYHPHIREDLQQELGLSGNFIVSSKESNYWNPVNREETLILDDILIEDGKIAPISSEFANYVMMGRFGNTMLINGETDYRLNLQKGEVIRLNLTNVSNTRVYDFQVLGAKMKRVGGDIGKYEREEYVESVIIAPAERYIVELYFPESGQFLMKNTTPVSNYTLGTITVSDEITTELFEKSFSSLRENAEIISDIDIFRPFFDKEIDKEIELDMDMNMGMGSMMMGGESHGGIEWEDEMGAMNKMHTSEQVDWKITDIQTGMSNMDIDWSFSAGDIVKIRVYNKEDGGHPMQHPIHLHGQRFLILNENGTSNSNLVWKDTALVKTGEYIDILVDMSNPGEWMAHCHIAEHLTAGMMMHFSVK